MIAKLKLLLIGLLYQLSVMICFIYTVTHNCYVTYVDLLLQLGDPNLRLLRIYGSSIERKNHKGPYGNKEVCSYMLILYVDNLNS